MQEIITGPSTNHCMPTLTELLDNALDKYHAGNLAEASALCREILTIDSMQPDANHLLGVIARTQLNFTSAYEYLARAIQLKPHELQFQLNFAAVLIDLGKAAEAKSHLQQIDKHFPTSDKIALMLARLELESSNPHQAQIHFEQALIRDNTCIEALIQLGLIAKHLAEFNKAITYLRAALSLLTPSQPQISEPPEYPERAAILGALGDCYKSLGQYVFAIDTYENSLKNDPNNVNHMLALASALYSDNQMAKALGYFQNALALETKNQDAAIGIIQSLLALNRTEDAYQASENFIAFHPHGPLGYINATAILELMNRLEEAMTLGEKALLLFPMDPKLTINLAICYRRKKRYAEAVELLKTLDTTDITEIADITTESTDTKARQLFELGKLYDKLNQTDCAYEYFCRANQIASQNWGDYLPQRQKYFEKIDHLSAAFTADNYRSWLPFHDQLTANASPIFLVGFPRSGTTLLDQILDSHPAIQTLEEKPVINAVEDEIVKLALGYPGAIPFLTQQQIETFQALYFKVAAQYITLDNKHLFIDKLPLNLAEAGLILRIFPKAKFILAVRHPCDVCLSCFMQHFSYNASMAHFVTLEGTVNAYDALMGLWQQYARELPLIYHTVRYEDLLKDFDAETKRITQFLGVEWHESLLNFDEHARQRLIHTPSYQQVSQPLYQDSVYRWKKYAQYFAPFMKQLQPHIDYFSYTNN